MLSLRLTSLFSAVAAATLLSACGGGGDSTGAASTPVASTQASTGFTGSVVKGPVSGATVCAYKAVASGLGDPLSCESASATGSFVVKVLYTGDVVLEARGGTYTDEATNTTKTLSEPMQWVVSSQGGTVTGVITPLTSIAYSLSKSASGGVTLANFNAAATSVASMFQLGTTNIATTVPVVSGATNAYGNILRAVSKFVANGGSLNAFVNWTSPASFQTAFGTAYAAINGGGVNFTFGAGAGTKTLTVRTTVPGSTGSITVATLFNVVQPASQTEFCNSLATDSTFRQIGSTATGGSLTINSCSYANNVGTIGASVTLSSPATTVPYTVTYTYQ